VALRREIVDLRRLDLLDDADEVRGVGKVAVMKVEGRARLMEIVIEMIDPPGVERRRPPFDAVDLVSFAEKKVRKIRAVLAGRAEDQCDFPGHAVPVS